GNEVQAAWRLAVESKDKPTALVLTRQGLPTLEGTKELAYEGVSKGAYTIGNSDQETPDVLLLATGSEVQLAIAAQKSLKEKGIDASVVSMPSWDRFDEQDDAYKNKVLPPQVKHRVAIEMGASLGWHKYVGSEGIVLGIDTFGASGKGDLVVEEYGFSVSNVVKNVEALLE